MSVPNRRSRYLFLMALFVIAIVATSLTILSRSHSKRQAPDPRQQAAVEAIRRRGGIVVSKSDLTPDVISVDLSRVVVDAELIQTVGQFTGMERLSLDGAKLQPDDWALLDKLPRLQSLSLSQSNVSDSVVSRLSPALRSLSFKGTQVTDTSMSRLTAMNELTSLNIVDTEVTADGLRLLAPLTSLKMLWIDESCITAESAESLRIMPLQSVEVAVLDDLGRRTYELLSVCKRHDIRGYHRDGYVLWETDSAWSDTLAGVVEATVSEIGLDSQQAARLLEVLGDEQGWAVTAPDPPISAKAFWTSTDVPDKGLQIESVDEFIGEDQQNRSFDYWALRRFGREKFAASDVPKLLDALRTAHYSTHNILFTYGPFLLVQHGIDNPEVLAELDRLLTHNESFVRDSTVCAFGFGGAEPFYSREEWVPSKAADAFAVPRLQRICHDEEESDQTRDAARMVLVDIAHRQPEYAAQVMTALVDLIESGPSYRTGKYPRPISRVDVAGLAEINKDAAVAAVPRLREMLTKLDEQLAGVTVKRLNDVKSPEHLVHGRRWSVLEALSVTARHNPALAHEIALMYLNRKEEGQPIGPFDTLLSSDTPETNRMVVMALLRDAKVSKYELASIAKKVRDWRTTH